MSFKKKRREINFMRQVRILNPTKDNIDQIIKLFESEFGHQYLEQEFNNYKGINNLLKSENVIWKCVFIENELIGQSLLEIRHNVGYIKYTIIKRHYRNQGILTLLGYYIANEIQKFSASRLLYIYAVIDNDNDYVKKFIEKYGFKKLGITPHWKTNKLYIIYGRNSFKNKEIWRFIKIHKDLYKYIFPLIQKIHLKRYVQTNFALYINYISKKDFNISIDNINSEKQKIISIDRENKKESIGFSYVNSYQKSWYDFRFIKKISNEVKFHVIKKLLTHFKENKKLNSFSILVNINDIGLQEILIHLGFLFYAYLPYFLMGIDYISMGISKIKNK